MSQPCHCAFLQSSSDTRTEEEGVLGLGRKLVEGEWKGRGKEVWRLLTSGSHIVLGDWGVVYLGSINLWSPFHWTQGSMSAQTSLAGTGCLYLYREHFGLWLMYHLGLCIAQHWPGGSGSSNFSPDTGLFLTFLFFFLLNKSLSHHSVSSDLFQNNCLRIAS